MARICFPHDSYPTLIVGNAFRASGVQQSVACFMKPVKCGPQVESGIGQFVASRRVPLRGKDSGRTPEPLDVVQCVDGIASSLHWGGATGSFEVD